jgi:hypothetical protein
MGEGLRSLVVKPRDEALGELDMVQNVMKSKERGHKKA